MTLLNNENQKTKKKKFYRIGSGDCSDFFPLAKNAFLNRKNNIIVK